MIVWAQQVSVDVARREERGAGGGSRKIRIPSDTVVGHHLMVTV
jgi:hypothetical protein